MEAQGPLSGSTPPLAWRWGEHELWPAQRQLLRAGEPVEVEARVFDLPLVLLENHERRLERQEVIAAIWGKRPVSDATLRQLVYKARRAVGDDGDHQATISTLYGRSMQWVAPVQRIDDDGAAHVGASDDDVSMTAAAPAASGPPMVEPTFPAVERRMQPAWRAAPPPADDSPLPRGIPKLRGSRRWVWLGLALLVLAGSGVGGWALLRPARGGTGNPAPAGATIAVMPFIELDQSPNQRYIGDGVSEELINRLARMPHLRVIARTSSFALRDKREDVREVARTLGVSNVLEGSVQRSGKQWRVRVALVDARNDFELWANEYNVDAGDLLGMEDHIADSVVRALYPQLQAGSRPVSPPGHRVDPAAHDAYLVGREYLQQRNAGDIRNAIAYFQRAIQADPAYAEACTSLAAAYAIARDYDADALPDTHFDDALAAVHKALLLDPQSAHAHAVLGLLLMRHWQWGQAEAEYRRALQLDPNDATAHQWYAILFWFTGDMQAALAQMRLAQRLDPLSPVINVDLSRALLYAGNEDAALAQARNAVALAPRFALGHLFLASALGGKGQYSDAIKEINAAIALAPQPTSNELSFLGSMEWAAGSQAQARKLLDQVRVRASQHYVSGVALALLEWAVGDKDAAFVNLRRAASDHDGLLMTVSGVRGEAWDADPRFAKLLASMNLPPR